jgi:hypothetical protein
LFITAIALALRTALIKAMQKSDQSHHKRQAFLTIAVGVLLGILVSLTSVGAGAIGVTTLILLYPLLPTVRLIGSDIAHAVPLTLVAGVGYFMIGSVNLPILYSLLVGSIPGIVLGSWIAPKFPEAVLRYLLASVLVVVGYRILSK